MNLKKPIAAVMALSGLALIVMSFINPPSLLQIAGALVGLGFICLGVLQVKGAPDSRPDEERYQQIMSKLEKIEKELEKVEQPRGTGVVIADVLASGLKYYAEHMSPPKEEEEK